MAVASIVCKARSDWSKSATRLRQPISATIRRSTTTRRSRRVSTKLLTGSADTSKLPGLAAAQRTTSASERSTVSVAVKTLTVNSGSASTVKTSTPINVHLKKGYNEIRLSNAKGWMPDIDYIEVAKVK